MKQIPGIKIGIRMWVVKTKMINNQPTYSICPIVTDENGVPEKHQWLPMQPIVAKDRNHAVFAFKDFESCKQYTPDVKGSVIRITGAIGNADKVGIIGRVSLWGEVQEHTKGYKAQYAYPYEFLLPDDAEIHYYGMVYRLAATYMVRVREVKVKDLHEAIWGKENGKA